MPPEETPDINDPTLEISPSEEEQIEKDYTPHQKWAYKKIIYEVGPQSWIDLADSFYRAAEDIVNGVAKRELFEDIEGIAGIFAFRHFLELILKQIITNARWLVEPYINATQEEFKEVARIHDLEVLWGLVLRDAQPKLRQYWDNYDIEFVEKCIMEFDAADKTGFTWRYPLQGCEKYRYDFQSLCLSMKHVQQVLKVLSIILFEMYSQNDEWEAEMRSWVD